MSWVPNLYSTGLCRMFEIYVMVDLDLSPQWDLESLWKCISGCVYESLSRWKTHFECWQHVPVGWGPGLSKDQKTSWEPEFLSLLPDIDATWPPASCSFHHSLPTMMNCALKLWVKINPSLSRFCHRHEKGDCHNVSRWQDAVAATEVWTQNSVSSPQC